MMYLLKQLSISLQHRVKLLLQPILSELPPPYNPNRSENRIILLLASAFVTTLIFFSILRTSKLILYRKSAKSDSVLPIDSEHGLAYRESLGFFQDIPDDVWKQKKKRAKDQPRHNDAKLGFRSKLADRDHASIWYQNNWEANFSCPHERRIGGSGDGAKWTCDPHRIQSVATLRQQAQQQDAPALTTDTPTNPCLIYSIGHHGKRPIHTVDPTYFDFSYEQSILSPAYVGEPGSCEVHIFDPWLASYLGPTPPGLTLHPWGIEGEADAHLGRRDYMTLGETVELLGHGGMEVDVFKVDCEACEWHTFREWFDHSKGGGKGIVMRQILVELHGAPQFGVDFFETMERNHFVIFHREADTQYAGIWQEYAFLRLAPEFFSD